MCSQLPNVILVLQSSDLGFQTLSSFADDSGTLDKSKSLSKARRRIIGGKITHWLDRQSRWSQLGVRQRQADRVDRQTDRADRITDRQTVQTDKLTDRQTERRTERLTMHIN